jgi:hypothetical protein
VIGSVVELGEGGQSFLSWHKSLGRFLEVIMVDVFENMNEGLTAPGNNLIAITPSDSTDLPQVSRGIYVGGAGNLVVTPAAGGSNVTFVAVPAGTVLPIRVTRVLSTSTTATSLINLY